jgi:hypothetical protein
MAGVVLAGVMLTGVLTAGSSAARASASACPAGQITGSAVSPTGAGYWLVDSGGDVFSFGDARFAGSVGGKSQSKPLRKPVVAIVPTRSGSGYWEVAADGAVFAFGDAVAPAGNRLPGTKLKAPVVGAARVGANGLELAAADGAVYPARRSARLRFDGRQAARQAHHQRQHDPGRGRLLAGRCRGRCLRLRRFCFPRQRADQPVVCHARHPLPAGA